MWNLVRGRLGPITVVIALVLGLAACGSDDDGGDDGDSAESAGTKVAAIFPDPINSGNWSPAGHQAFTEMVDTYDFDSSFQERVAHDQAEGILRRLGGENEMVIAHSSAYEAAALEVAAEFPETWFIVFSDLSGTNGLENIAGWKMNWNEMGYLAGTAACLAAKSEGSSAIGHVNSSPIPAFTRYAGGAKDAAEDHDCEYMITWTDTLDDLGKAQQAAIALADDGAGAILTSGNAADQGAYRGAAEAGVFFVSLHFDESDVDSEHYLTGVTPDFEGSYDQMGDLLTSDSLEAKAYPLEVANDGVKYVSEFQNVDEEVERESREVVERIKSGDLEVDPTNEITP